MKILKTVGVLILTAIAVAMILMLVMPNEQRIERHITINASSKDVFDHLSSLDNFNKWSSWSRKDSLIKHTLSGVDGTPGAASTWKGDPELSGEGSIRIRSLEMNREIKHDIKFLHPREMNAKSEFELKDLNGQTQVTWQFILATPRPWNIFNLFRSMEKEMGQDFEDGLRNLKMAIESGGKKGTVKTYDVKQMNFPATTYATYREVISWKDIPGFYAQHMPQLIAALTEASITPGLPSGLYYEWDEKNQRTDMAVALPISRGSTLKKDSIQVIDLAGSKAVFVDYYGAYDKSMHAYATLDEFLAKNNLKQKAPVIEQYITDTQVEKDTAKWHTRIIFLIQ